MSEITTCYILNAADEMVEGQIVSPATSAHLDFVANEWTECYRRLRNLTQGRARLLAEVWCGKWAEWNGTYRVDVLETEDGVQGIMSSLPVPAAPGLPMKLERLQSAPWNQATLAENLQFERRYHKVGRVLMLKAVQISCSNHNSNGSLRLLSLDEPLAFYKERVGMEPNPATEDPDSPDLILPPEKARQFIDKFWHLHFDPEAKPLIPLSHHDT